MIPKKALLLFFIFPLFSFSQEQTDTGRLRDLFYRAHIYGNVRSFLMATDNPSPLNDYYALGSAAALKFVTGLYKGLSFRAGGALIYRVLSSDLSKPDPLSGAPSRYEAELFSISDPMNKNVRPRFEEAALYWEKKDFVFSIGRRQFGSPLLNPQDGRLRPGFAEGVFLGTREFNGLSFSAGWVDRISPRSTVDFYRVGDAIGIYPQGVSVDGKKSDYHGNLSSAGMALLDINYNTHNRWEVGCWDYFVENIFNTAQLETQYTIAGGGALPACSISAMFIHQDALNNGGNADASKAYFTKGGQSNAGSVRLNYKRKALRFLLSYSFITGDGRFLFPREWGSEPFYTFMPPERTEGSGNTRSVDLLVKVREKKKLSGVAGFGYFKLPDVLDYRLNKYGLPSFYQCSAGMKYDVEIYHSRFSAELLYVYKGDVGDTHDKYRYIDNKVNMSHYNLILNYYFYR